MQKILVNVLWAIVIPQLISKKQIILAVMEASLLPGK